MQTLGGFRLWRGKREIEADAWGREKALHLFQFLVTTRRRRLHKEQIIDQLWPELDLPTGDRDFKVALNAVLKTLEPDRAPRETPRFVRRDGLTYSLDREVTRVDVEVFEEHVDLGNQALLEDPAEARKRYRAAVQLYHGDFLPERRYEDWAGAERERIQTLALGTMTQLAALLVEEQALEALQLTQRVLELDPLWENAYRTQMRAYRSMGNRPLVIRTYERCREMLAREFDMEPLPETRALYEEVAGVS